MNRTDRKCFAASTALHGLLLGIVLVCPAFISTRTPTPPAETPVLYAIPANAIMSDDATRGGGNPNARVELPPRQAEPAPPTPQQPVQQTPPPQPPPRQPDPTPVEPDPEPAPTPAPRPRAEPRPVKPAPVETLVDRTPTAKPRIKVSDKVETRTERRDTSKDEEAAAAKERERRAAAAAAAAAKRRADRLLELAGSVDKAAQGATRDLGQNLSGGTEVDIPGPGGAAFVNYAQFVQSAYYNAWLVPEGVENNVKVVVARVVVGRNGRIVDQRISESSGNRALDRSVQDALDRVRLKGLPAFPEDSKDLQRTFLINFNLQTKRMTG